MSKSTKATVLCVIATLLGLVASAAWAQEAAVPHDLSADTIRQAQRMVLNRIIRDADKGDPAELLKLSQTLSTLQAAEGQQDVLMVARAIEPQLDHLPELVQHLQREIVGQQVGQMLAEFRHHDEEVLPLMKGFIQIWGNSLDMGDKVRQDIAAADAAADEDLAEAHKEEYTQKRMIVSTYSWKYAGSNDSDQVYQFVRRDGAKMDAKADKVLVDYFDDTWTSCDDQYILEGDEAKALNPKGVLMSFSPWSWDNEAKAKLEALRGYTFE